MQCLKKKILIQAFKPKKSTLSHAYALQLVSLYDAFGKCAKSAKISKLFSFLLKNDLGCDNSQGRTFIWTQTGLTHCKTDTSNKSRLMSRFNVIADIWHEGSICLTCRMQSLLVMMTSAKTIR